MGMELLHENFKLCLTLVDLKLGTALPVNKHRSSYRLYHKPFLHKQKFTAHCSSKHPYSQSAPSLHDKPFVQRYLRKCFVNEITWHTWYSCSANNQNKVSHRNYMKIITPALYNVNKIDKDIFLYIYIGKMITSAGVNVPSIFCFRTVIRS